jgi:hypothetical protein
MGDYKEAARLLGPLAESGSAWAHANLGWMHQHGLLGSPDLEKAIAAFENAAIPGYSEAKYFLGQALQTKGDRDRAEAAFRDGAAEGDLRCVGELTRIEEERAWEALEAWNYRAAARLFEPLAERGSVYALINLGWMYSRGHLGARDPKKAIALWEEAVRMGSIDAKHRIARTLLDNGDLPRARTLFLEGAEWGYKPSIYWAGRMLIHGQGGEADRRAGVALLKRAADGGHVFAHRELLRLELNDARSVLGRLRAHGKIALGILAVVRRAIRDPKLYCSDDFR